MSDLHQSMSQLCAHFELLLERQETMLAVVQAQGAAARAHDIEGLEAKTAALALLIQENAQAEKERLLLLKEVVATLDLPLEQQTLSGLVLAAPAPWARRLEEFQARMRDVLAETRATIRQNNFVMRRCIRVVGDAVQSLAQCLPSQAADYNASGGAPVPRGAAPALLDQRG